MDRTGNRMLGIGKGLVAAYLNLSNTSIVAAIRNIASGESLRSLPSVSGSRLVVVETDVARTESIKRGIALLKLEQRVNTLYVVLANAGIAAVSSSLSKMSISDTQSFVDVNAYGQSKLFKAVAPLPQRSSSGAPGKFVYMSGPGRSFSAMNNIAPLLAYGASKALGHCLFK